jgi:hypothetical protein
MCLLLPDQVFLPALSCTFWLCCFVLSPPRRCYVCTISLLAYPHSVVSPYATLFIVLSALLSLSGIKHLASKVSHWCTSFHLIIVLPSPSMLVRPCHPPKWTLSACYFPFAHTHTAVIHHTIIFIVPRTLVVCIAFVILQFLYLALLIQLIYHMVLLLSLNTLGCYSN